MAILEPHPGVNISVICNGAALHEYDDEDEDAQPATATKYVEAESGAEFGVQWELQRHGRSMPSCSSAGWIRRGSAASAAI